MSDPVFGAELPMKRMLLVAPNARAAAAISQQMPYLTVAIPGQALTATSFDSIVVLAPLTSSSPAQQAMLDDWRRTTLMTCLAPDGVYTTIERESA